MAVCKMVCVGFLRGLWGKKTIEIEMVWDDAYSVVCLFKICSTAADRLFIFILEKKKKTYFHWMSV